MEKEQIIKALEICANYKGCSDCKECPLHNDEYVQCEQNVLEGLALALIKELTEENERLTKQIEMSEAAYQELQFAFSICANQVKADTVREIFKEIYSSCDYIEEQMEPEEIPECFFSVREDIDALKVRFEGEGREE